MGNWPSVLSDEGSEGSIESDNQEESSDQAEDVPDEQCDSEKSFFSEDELLPVVDTDDGDARDEVIHTPDILSVEEDDDEIVVDEVDGSQYDLAPEYHPPMLDEDVTARFTQLTQPDGHEQRCYSSTDEEEEEEEEVIDDEDDDDRYYHTRKIDIYSAMKEDDDDEPSSIPLPPPSSPYEVSSTEQMQVVTTSLMNADHSGPLQETIIPVESHVEQCSAPERVVAWEIDVSDMTGPKKTSKKRPPNKLSKAKSRKSSSKSSVASSYIPPSVSTTPELIAQRKCLDQKRWFCMSRPQYSKSCGLSSLVSCWNYLFSTLGGGTMPPITQEEALTVLGFQPPFGEIRFGPFTGNATLMRWFKQLNDHYGVRGRAYFQYKPHGRSRTVGRTSAEGLHLLQQGLKDPNMAFIYHCYNHYFCPIGYEDVPLKAVDAYRDPLNPDEVETWILIGDPSRKHPGIHCFKWEDISTDLNCQNPYYLNIRKLQLGVQQRRTKKTGGNLHCIMAFCRSAGFLTRPSKSRKEVAKKASSGQSKSSETISVRVSGHKVEKSKSEGMVGKKAPRGSATCPHSNKADSSTVIKEVASETLSDMSRSEVSSSKAEMVRKTESKPKVSRRKVKSSVGKNENKEVKAKGSDPKKKVVRKVKKQKSSTKVNNNKDRDETSPTGPFSDEIDLVQVDLTLPTTSDDQTASDDPTLHRHRLQSIQARIEDTDEVVKFIRNVSTHFTQGLNQSELAEVEALKTAMNQSASSPSIDNKREEDWVLLGQSNTPGRAPSHFRSTGEAVMGLSDFRGMGTDDLVNVDDLREGVGQEGEVSDLAKHLIDQYLVSILDSIDRQSGNRAPATDDK